MKQLPAKLFNRCGQIPTGTTIHITRVKGKYRFIGIRPHRKKNKAIIYSIPNRKNPRTPNFKGFQSKEADEAWAQLIKRKKISRKWFERYLPELVSEGPCYWSAFYGIICYLHPYRFNKSKSEIYQLKTRTK